MRELRAGLEENADESCIEWERGSGYRYQPPPPPPPVEELTPVPLLDPKLQTRRILTLIGPLLTALLVIVGLALFFLVPEKPKSPDPVSLSVTQASVTWGLSPEQVQELIKAVGSGIAGAAGPLLDPQDPLTRDLKERGEAAMKAGQLAEADQLVSEAEQAELSCAAISP